MLSNHAHACFFPKYQSLSQAMLSNHAHACFFLKYPHKIIGVRENEHINTHGKGYVIQFRVPVNQMYTILNKSNDEHFFRCQSRFSAFANDPDHIDKSNFHNGLLTKYHFAAQLENAELEPDCSRSFWASALKQLNAFYRFSRPHTVMGTAIGIISVSLLPVESMADLSPTFLMGLIKALLPSIFMNIYVVGLNQLFDIQIDKVNKPDLPLVSGEFSIGVGIAIVAASCFMSFAMGLMFQSPPLFSALLISFLVGSVYSINVGFQIKIIVSLRKVSIVRHQSPIFYGSVSRVDILHIRVSGLVIFFLDNFYLPFLRWKRHALLAATCILSVRAIVVQFAFFIHIQKYTFRRPTAFTRSLVFATAFMCFFSSVIALFKDIPDVDGDRSFGIQSFSVRLGQQRVFWLCINLLLTAYGAAMVVGASSSSISSKLVTVLGHGALASILWHRAQSLDLKNKSSITSFYMFIWKLFYAEYLLIPFVR